MDTEGRSQTNINKGKKVMFSELERMFEHGETSKGHVGLSAPKKMIGAREVIDLVHESLNWNISLLPSGPLPISNSYDNTHEEKLICHGKMEIGRDLVNWASPWIKSITGLEKIERKWVLTFVVSRKE